jgi:uncharacterized protein (TIGR00299 family) protein
MSGRRFALLDPAAGISGDMVLGALLDLGVPADWLIGLPSRLGLNDVTVTIEETTRCGVRAKKATVRLGRATETPGDVSEHELAGLREHQDQTHHPHGQYPHGGGTHHHPHGDQPHRHVGELLAMIGRAPLSDWVKERATRAFRLLADAEGRVHGVSPEDVALHEVGAFDALVDIVGAIEGFERLGITEVYTRPLALGNGWVHAAHGVLSVPTPATALLVEGLPVTSGGPVVGEATTPTGAALVRALATTGDPPAPWRARATGWGAGGRDPERYPNVLRIVVGDTADVAEDLVVLATDLDDLSPEYLEPLREALMNGGALDVVSWSTQMKKGRIGFRVEALAPLDRADAVAEAFFRHSTTGGVRRWPVSRTALRREQWSIPGPDGGPVRVKTLHGPAGARVKPEYDDVMAAARRTGQPALEVSRTLQEQAHRLVGPQPVGRPRGDIEPHKESAR